MFASSDRDTCLSRLRRACIIQAKRGVAPEAGVENNPGPKQQVRLLPP